MKIPVISTRIDYTPNFWSKLLSATSDFSDDMITVQLKQNGVWLSVFFPSIFPGFCHPGSPPGFWNPEVLKNPNNGQSRMSENQSTW